MDELVDFSFIYEELNETYCHDKTSSSLTKMRECTYAKLDIWRSAERVKSKKYKKPWAFEEVTFQESESFKAKAKERYKIEAKNSELKHRHGYDVASSSGLIGMEIQGLWRYSLSI